MITETTDRKLKDAAYELVVLRYFGHLGEEEEVPFSQIARQAGVSEATIHKIFRSALSRAISVILQDPDLDPVLRRLAAARLRELNQ